MYSLDRIIISKLDDDKATGDFRIELAKILELNVAHVCDINVEKTIVNGTIIQKMIVDVKKSTFTKKQLDKIPFETLNTYHETSEFIFDMGSVPIES